MKAQAVDVLGHRMFLDDLDSLGLANAGIWEQAETRFFQGEVKPGNVVLDIGANIGYYTLMFARAVGADGHVYAFEPEPSNFELLSRNIELNGYENVTLVNKALASEDGHLELYLSSDNLGDHQAYPTDEGRTVVRVEATALDSFLQDDRRPIDFIKMDVQGAEPFVIEGMLETLARSPNVRMVAEFWPRGLKAAGSSAGAFLQRLEGLGLRYSQLREASDRVFPLRAINNVLRTVGVSNLRRAELLKPLTGVRPIRERQLLRNYTLERGHHTSLLWQHA